MIASRFIMYEPRFWFLLLMVLAIVALKNVLKGNTPPEDAGASCGTCGAKFPSFARFCPRCGRNLQKDAGPIRR
jgi:hypothetical protein